MDFLNSVPWLRAIMAGGLVFFAPGFAWTLILFRRIGVIERIVFSFAISIAAATLCILLFSLVPGIAITGTSSLIAILAVTGIPLAIYLARIWLRQRKGIKQDEQASPIEHETDMNGRSF